MENKLPLSLTQLVENLTEPQLHELYHLVIERLKLFDKVKSLYAMKDFRIGDYVSFDYHGQEKRGTIVRLNQRTITIQVDGGVIWKVSPNFLRKA